ncbi:DUF6894 family protein [Mesorhizobium sp. IMUNJ 23232]|uniref:DUF6894 family protein n=1 Tax=Mesorhizobium sp. IMUNJ 23232 TaxID=3376064 RepID=UPI0037A455BB
MPRYYFDVFDGQALSRDNVGIERDHENNAGEQAVAALREMAHEELIDGIERDFWVKVRDDEGTYIFAADLKFKAGWLKR